MEQDPSTATLDRLIKINPEDQSFLIRYWARLPLEYRIAMTKRHRKLLHKIKEQNPDIGLEILSYAALILALKSIYSEEKKLTQKRFDEMSMDEIADLSLLKIKKFDNRLPSPTPKRDKLIHYWAVVKVLRNQKKSFRNIAKYLKAEYRFEVGHTLIQTTWNELEKV